MSIAPGRPRMIQDVWESVAPKVRWTDLMAWPPDVLAVVGCVLAESGAYRLVVSPPNGCRWPEPNQSDPRDWDKAVREDGQGWAAWAARRKGKTRPPLPLAVKRALRMLSAARPTALADLAQPSSWPVTSELLTLFALADEACAGLLATGSPRPFHVRAHTRLARTGSVSRLRGDRVRVLPKFRVPTTGITMRSLSRNVAFEHSEVKTSWLDSFSVERADQQNRFTMLLVPWPRAVSPKDFRQVPGPELNMSRNEYGFFEFRPDEPFDIQGVIELVGAAQTRVGPIDMVVLPESAVEETAAGTLRTELLNAGVPFLLAGVRKEGTGAFGVTPAGRLGENYAYLAGVRSDGTRWEVKQYKHHRWFLDKAQIEQYHLGPALDPRRGWWEAIDVGGRELNFVGIRDWLTLCPLICEDLARPDPVANLIRSVGPSLVIALLFDGPQLSSRWPSRYATVLADDPGSAVLTLSSLGLVRRCLPAGKPRSRVVALWKDAKGDPRQIEIEEHAEAIALTVAASSRTGITADGRTDDGTTADVALSGIEQIYRSGANSSAGSARPGGPPTGLDPPQSVDDDLDDGNPVP